MWHKKVAAAAAVVYMLGVGGKCCAGSCFEQTSFRECY